MNEQQRAEEHLRVIRTLMERATIYRAISAPTALVGGLLAVAASAFSVRTLADESSMQMAGGHFLILWLSVLLVTIAANSLFVWQAARKRNEAVVSPSMKLALRALLPSVLAAGVITLPLCVLGVDNYLVALVWTLFYGLALLATAHFSPKSLILLGWAFLLTSLALYVLPFAVPTSFLAIPTDRHASLLMGATFGVYHLIYAACVWHRGAVEATE